MGGARAGRAPPLDPPMALVTRSEFEVSDFCNIYY